MIDALKLRVTPIDGHPGCYDVESKSGGQPHTVNIFEFRGNGKCECPHFEYRMLDKLQKGAEPSPELMCDHLIAANFEYAREQKIMHLDYLNR